MSEPLLSIRDVAVAYRQRMSLWKKKPHLVLSGITFDLFPGETLGIIGRNGAGKSTLLRLMAGILRPDRGKVVNHGASVSMLSLNLGLDPQLDGIDNAILSGLLLGFSRREAERNLAAIVEFSELGEAITEPVKTYSTGMMARLGFSIAIHLHPDVLLIDEVLGVGDIDFRKKSAAFLKKKIVSDQTVVLVSHEPGIVGELCDRTVWIENGALCACGDTQAVLEQYEAGCA